MSHESLPCMLNLSSLKLGDCISIEFLVEDTSAEAPFIPVGHQTENVITFNPVRSHN
jgi:hypothetical protein